MTARLREIFKTVETLKNAGVKASAYRIDGDYSKLRSELAAEGLDLDNEAVRLAMLYWGEYEERESQSELMELLKDCIDQLNPDNYDHVKLINRYKEL
jgi:hypothetical protein